MAGGPPRAGPPLDHGQDHPVASTDAPSASPRPHTPGRGGAARRPRAWSSQAATCSSARATPASSPTRATRASGLSAAMAAATVPAAAHAVGHPRGLAARRPANWRSWTGRTRFPGLSQALGLPVVAARAGRSPSTTWSARAAGPRPPPPGPLRLIAYQRNVRPPRPGGTGTWTGTDVQGDRPGRSPRSPSSGTGSAPPPAAMTAVPWQPAPSAPGRGNSQAIASRSLARSGRCRSRLPGWTPARRGRVCYGPRRDGTVYAPAAGSPRRGAEPSQVFWVPGPPPLPARPEPLGAVREPFAQLGPLAGAPRIVRACVPRSGQTEPLVVR